MAPVFGSGNWSDMFAPEYGYVVLTGTASGETSEKNGGKRCGKFANCISSFLPAFMLTWKSIQVGKARKKFGVKYPKMYSEENGGDNVFNCVQVRFLLFASIIHAQVVHSTPIQRAHQNTVENYPQFLFLLLTGGLSHPCVASAAGLVWIAGRIAYGLGYSTGKDQSKKSFLQHVAPNSTCQTSGQPEKRMKGAFGYVGLLALLGCSIHTGYKMITW